MDYDENVELNRRDGIFNSNEEVNFMEWEFHVWNVREINALHFDDILLVLLLSLIALKLMKKFNLPIIKNVVLKIFFMAQIIHSKKLKFEKL